jgi:hypothetical protein
MLVSELGGGHYGGWYCGPSRPPCLWERGVGSLFYVCSLAFLVEGP